MRNETFSVGGATCTVASRTRRSTINAALYRQYIQEGHPEIVAYEQELYLLVPPKEPELPRGTPKERVEAAQAAFEQKSEEHVGKVNALRAKHPVGAAYETAASYIYNGLSRITSLKGTEFDSADGRFTKPQILKAFELYLDTDDNEFWIALWQNIFRLDLPLTPAQEKPPEYLTEAEKESPLFVPVEESSRRVSSDMSTS